MKKKIVKICIISLLMIWVYSTIVNALSFSTIMTPSSTAVEESTEFNVRVSVSNLDAGTNGINALSGTIKYDEDVFEELTESSIEGLNSWKPEFNASTGKITLTKTTFVKDQEAVFQITLKTKSDISGKKGTISFTNIVASNSEADITGTDISTSITIGEDDTNTANVTNNTNTGVLNIVPINTVSNNTANNTSENTSENNTSNNTNSYRYNVVNNTSSDDDIPYTGVEDTILYIIIALIVVALVFYIKFEKVNKEIK